MWNAIGGSVVGGLVAGTIALVAGAASGPDRGTSSPSSDPAIVQCEPHQQATMRRAMVDGREVSTLSCVTAPVAYGAPAGYAMNGEAALPYAPVYAPTAFAPQPYAPQSYAPMVAQPVATLRPAVVEQREVIRQAPRTKKRSWAKSALVIGGTTGAGAGVGALVGGKKGALIGAALGGGSGAIFEAIKRPRKHNTKDTKKIETPNTTTTKRRQVFDDVPGGVATRW